MIISQIKEIKIPLTKTSSPKAIKNAVKIKDTITNEFIVNNQSYQNYSSIEELELNNNQNITETASDNDSLEEKLEFRNELKITEYVSSDGLYEEELANYQKKLDSNLASANGTREKAVVCAKFLATEFPKLPYFWGGGHDLTNEELIGINANWGKLETVKYGGSETYKEGMEYPYSLDCSGYVSWCFINAGYNINGCLNTSNLKNMGKSTKITDSNILEIAQPGDVAYMDGHVGMVIAIDKKQKEISVAHISDSGKGMNITTISTETCLITDDNTLTKRDQNGNLISSRVGKKYFTEIISIPYES